MLPGNQHRESERQESLVVARAARAISSGPGACGFDRRGLGAAAGGVARKLGCQGKCSCVTGMGGGRRRRVDCDFLACAQPSLFTNLGIKEVKYQGSAPDTDNII